MRSKKTAKQIVDEVVIKVNEELPAKVEAPKAVSNEEDNVLHYYRCNITMNNGKSCNCSAFM